MRHHVDNVIGHQGCSGAPPSIQAGQNVVPVKLAANSQLFLEHSTHKLSGMVLATRAAYLLGLTEDAVVLNGARVQDLLSQLYVIERGPELRSACAGMRIS